jgi:hypothetical protein
MAQPQDHDGNPEDTVSLKALSDEDLAYIAKNPGYRTMLQDILSPIIGENSSKDGSADNTASSSSKGRGTGTTRSAQKTRVPDQHSSSEEPSDDGSGEDSDTDIIEKLTHALRKRKKSSKSASKRQKVSGSETEPLLFDPSLDKEDKDEYKFDAPEVIGQYLEQHFRKGLAKEERTAMLKRHPKPNAKVMTQPKLDQFVSDFAPKKVDKARDAAMSRIQGSLLYAVNPLTNLWAELIKQGMADDPEALILVPEVLDIIQRSIVLIGNTNNLVSETRREVALDAIHSSLKKYAKGDFQDAGSDLFGEKFKDELVKKVEADTALSKAVRIVSRSSKVYQGPQSQSKGKAPLFQDSRTSGYGTAFGRRQNPYTGHARIYNSQSRGKFTPGKPYLKKSIFDRLGHKGGTPSRQTDQQN